MSEPVGLQVAPQSPDRNLALELVRVTEAAAMAAGRWVGRGDKNGADGVAVNAMRVLISTIGMRGTVHRHGMPPHGLDRNHPLEAVNVTTPADVGLLLDLILQGTQDAAAAARLGCTPELCQLGIDILSWQKLRNRLPAWLPSGTKVAHKTGTGPRNQNDAGIIYHGAQPLFILTVYTEHLPVELPDGMPGHSTAVQLIGRLCRTCYDALRVETAAV